MEIHHWIKWSRLNAGMTQEELGDLLGVTKANVSSWEKGRHRASYQQLVRIGEITKQALPAEAATQELSPDAIDLAKALDAIRDERVKKIAYSMCIHSIQLAKLNDPGTPAP